MKLQTVMYSMIVFLEEPAAPRGWGTPAPSRSKGFEGKGLLLLSFAHVLTSGPIVPEGPHQDPSLDRLYVDGDVSCGSCSIMTLEGTSHIDLFPLF